jgi:hypothetical protein
MAESNPQTTSPKPLEYQPRPARDTWARFLADQRRWWAHLFSRESLVSFAKTMAWVAPLTILIWVYAEREQLAIDDDVPIPLDVRSSDPNRIVTLRTGDKTVLAALSGPRARLDEVRELLAPRGDQPAVVIEISPTLTPGRTHELNTLSQIRNASIFADTGVSVESCRPAMVSVFVDEIVERELIVQATPKIPGVQSVTFDPPLVKIRGPKAQLDTLDAVDEQGRHVVLADLSNYPVLRTPGQHELTDVPVVRPFRDDHVTLAPAKVKASVHVKESDASYTIAVMSIFVQHPPGLLDGFQVEFVNPDKPILTNVTVVGPPDRIEALQKEDFSPKPKAILEVAREDAGEPRTRRLKYDLPEGVRVIPEDARREIEFKLINRTAAP